MSRLRRVAAAIFLTALCAPGTLLRSDVSWESPDTIRVDTIEVARATGSPAWEVAGVWELKGEGLLFGGFSALIALPDDRLLAFSDRGARLTIDQPDRENMEHDVTFQSLEPARRAAVRDIEAAAIDPTSGMYWLAFENDHSVDRFLDDHSPAGARSLAPVADMLDWSNNSGAEAFTRLSDGRFVILPEGERVGLVYAKDPLEGGDHQTFAYRPPVAGHGATDIVQLPDGRVLLLLRNLDVFGGTPPFESKIALGPAPRGGKDAEWAPEITLDLEGVVPRENYEGIAVRPLADGRVAVWLIADDNLSVMQRTLVVKLLLDPKKLGTKPKKKPDKAKGAQD